MATEDVSAYSGRNAALFNQQALAASATQYWRTLIGQARIQTLQSADKFRVKPLAMIKDAANGDWFDDLWTVYEEAWRRSESTEYLREMESALLHYFENDVPGNEMPYFESSIAAILSVFNEYHLGTEKSIAEAATQAYADTAHARMVAAGTFTILHPWIFMYSPTVWRRLMNFIKQLFRKHWHSPADWKWVSAKTWRGRRAAERIRKTFVQWTDRSINDLERYLLLKMDEPGVPTEDQMRRLLHRSIFRQHSRHERDAFLRGDRPFMLAKAA